MTIILIIIANLWLNSSFPISLGFNQRKKNKKNKNKKKTIRIKQQIQTPNQLGIE